MVVRDARWNREISLAWWVDVNLTIESCSYEGEWVNDHSCGKGRLYHADGDLYQGDWRDDKANGKGEYFHVNGAKYTGDWVDDKQEGRGVETWPDGARYEGLYYLGKKDGKGLLMFADGSKYEGYWVLGRLGEFKANDIQGYGVYEWPDGRVFKGQWFANKMHGKGVISWPDGRKYTGVNALAFISRNTWRTRNMVKESLNGLMVENTLEHGKMDIKRALGCTFSRTRRWSMANGKMASEFVGS